MTSDFIEFIEIEMLAIFVAAGIDCCIWLVFSVLYELAKEWEKKNEMQMRSDDDMEL